MAISKRLRVQVLRRDGSRCRLCGATSDQKPLEVDHWVARAEGGTDDLDNLVTLCRDCNRGKGRLFFGLYAEAVRDQRVGAPSARPAIDPPVSYQKDAVRQVLAHLQKSGVPTVSIDQLAPLIGNVLLRDGINPAFEPLSFPLVEPGLAELVDEGTVVEEAGSVRIVS